MEALKTGKIDPPADKIEPLGTLAGDKLSEARATHCSQNRAARHSGRRWGPSEARAALTAVKMEPAVWARDEHSRRPGPLVAGVLVMSLNQRHLVM